MRLLVLLLIAGASALAQAEDWPQFRGPTGQGHATERGLPLEWSESKNILWKTAVPGLGWSSPAVAGGRVWLTTVVETKDRRNRISASLRALAFDVATGRELVNVEVFRIDDAGVYQSEEQPRLADADRRWRARLRALRRRRHGRAEHVRRHSVDDASAVRVAAWQRRIADAVSRPADRQLRRQRRRGVRRRARHEHRQDPLEDRAALAGRSGVLDAAGDYCRRSRPARLGRCVSGGSVRAADRTGRSGASVTATASRTCRARCTDRASSTSRPGFRRRRSSPSVRTGEAT